MKKVKLVAFKPFLDSETALKTLQQTNDGQVNSFLEEFLKANLPSDGKKFGVGV